MELEQTETQTREELFIQLYEDAFPDVAFFIKKMGGSLEDTKDIFQDALIIYYEKTTQQDLVIQHAAAYILGICKHLWYAKYRREEKHKNKQPPSDRIVKEDKEPGVSHRIYLLIERSGKKCLELLQSFYFEKRSMSEIATLFGFSGERSATTQKYKCLEKVREEIKNKSLSQEDFYE